MWCYATNWCFSLSHKHLSKFTHATISLFGQWCHPSYSSVDVLSGLVFSKDGFFLGWCEVKQMVQEYSTWTNIVWLIGLITTAFYITKYSFLTPTWQCTSKYIDENISGWRLCWTKMLPVFCLLFVVNAPDNFMRTVKRRNSFKGWLVMTHPKTTLYVWTTCELSFGNH